MHARLSLFVVALCLFTMPALAAITGTVMNMDGAPIAGARVSIAAFESGTDRAARLLSATPERPLLASAQSDAKGAFSLESPKHAVVTFQISAPGYSPTTRRAERDEDLGAIVLQRSETKRGAISAGGKPVENALIVITYGGYEYLTRTNAEGRYEAPDPKRASGIAVVHPDYAIEEKLFNITPANERDLSRALTAGTKLTGRVIGADGQTPVANATLFADQWPLAKSADDGTFTLTRVPERWGQILARSENMSAQSPYTKETALTLKLARAATIAGRITDAKTKAPVAGAVVRASSGSRIGRDAGVSVETDAKGAYSLPVNPGSYMVFASHPSYDAANGDVSIAAGQQTARDFVIAPLARVSGTVLDEEKRPVAAAVVAAEEQGDQMMRMMSGARMMRVDDTIYSGPDGRFSGRVGADRPLVMRANKRGFPTAQSEQFKLAPAERKAGVVLTIPSGIAVGGRVTDREGNPLSGVTVVAAQSDDGGRGAMVFRSVMVGGPQSEEDAVRSASDGTFTLRVKEGTYDFTFKREGFAPKVVRGQNIAFGAPASVETTLDAASDITGRVVRGGVGVEGVSVNAFGPGGSASSITGADGSFALTGLAAGQMRVMMRKEDEFISEMRALTAPSRDVVVELSAGGRVTGRVIDKGSGKPLTQFQAGISNSRSGGGMITMAPPQLRDFTSEDGSFTLENVPAGAMTLIATAPGYASAKLNVTIEEGKVLSDVELAVDAGVRLAGRVTAPNGTPLSEVTVRVAPSPTGAFAVRGTDSTAITDQNGEYSLEALQAGEETIMFSHANYVATRKQVTLKGRETKLDVQLSSGQRVTGTVVTEAGAPVADARVDAMSSGMRGESARTNSSGAFEIDSLVPGRYRFTASKSGVGEGSVDDIDVSTTQQVRITMKAGATIHGRVIGLAPEDYSLTTVMARAGRSSMSAPVDSSGNFRIEGAPTGTVSVSASVESRDVMAHRSSPPVSVEVAPGGSQSVDLRFRGDITVRGRVLRNGRPLPSAHVGFVPKRGSSAQTFASSSTDEQGVYSVNGIEEGEYTIEVIDMQRFSPYSSSYTVRGSATHDIEFKTAAIRGRVVDAATSEPLPNVTIQVSAAVPTDSFRMARTATTDSAGTFVLESIPPGSYVVNATRETYANDMREVTVTDRGDDLELKLTRQEGTTLKFVDARDGRPVRAGAFVYDTQHRLVHTGQGIFGGNDDGEVKLPLAAGQYVASIAATNYASVNVPLQLPSASRVIALSPGGTLAIRSKHSERRRLRILDSNGIPYQRTNNPLPSRDLLPSPGTTQILNIAPGLYTLQLLGAGDAVIESKQVQVQEGQTTETEL